MLQACLNGGRTEAEHRGVPRTPAALAADGRACVAAGAQVLHLHPYAASGVQTLEAAPCAAAVRAVRAACPGVPVSLSTAEGIEPDPDRRLALVAAWAELPDLVTANQDEPGIVALCEHLLGRGVAIEAGLMDVDATEAFLSSGLAGRCVRVLVEPGDADPAAAVAAAAAIEHALGDAGVALEQVHHGEGTATWAVIDRAVARGHGIRAGLEDATTLPDGTRAAGNAALVVAAAALLRLQHPPRPGEALEEAALVEREQVRPLARGVDRPVR